SHETYVPAQPPSSPEDAWLPDPDGDQEWPVGAEAPARQGPQAPDRVLVVVNAEAPCRRTRSARPSVCGAGESSSGFSIPVTGSRPGISRSCWRPGPRREPGWGSWRRENWATRSGEIGLND